MSDGLKAQIWIDKSNTLQGRIAELERENADIKETNSNMLTMSQRDSERIMAMASQAAAMRKALEEKLLTKGTQYGLPENCSKWTCECGVFSQFKEDISHLNSCPLSSDAPKRVLAILEAAREVDDLVKESLESREFEPSDNVIWLKMQPLRKLRNRFNALDKEALTNLDKPDNEENTDDRN